MNVLSSSSLKAKKRPGGITIVAVLWALYNITVVDRALEMVIFDIGFDPSAPEVLDLGTPAQEWLRLGVPAHMMLNISIAALGFLAMFTAYGLFTAKSWSYKPAIAVPAFTTINHGAVTTLYAMAPAELRLANDYSTYLSLTLISLGWMVVLLLYLRKPKAKQYIQNSSLRRLSEPPKQA